jgi:hypothetical protein
MVAGQLNMMPAGQLLKHTITDESSSLSSSS